MKKIALAGLLTVLGFVALGAERAPGKTRPVDPRVAAILEAARRTPKGNLVAVFVAGHPLKAASAPARELEGDGEWLILRMAKGAPETYVNVENITHAVFIQAGARPMPELDFEE